MSLSFSTGFIPDLAFENVYENKSHILLSFSGFFASKSIFKAAKPLQTSFKLSRTSFNGDGNFWQFFEISCKIVCVQAHKILVNSHYTLGVFVNAFAFLYRIGVCPEVVYPITVEAEKKLHMVLE